MQYVFQEGLFARIAVGNALLTTERLADELVEVGQLMKLGHASLETLLHGTDHDFLYTLQFDDAPFRIAAVQEGQLVEAYLCGFLGQPLHAIHILGGCQCQMQMAFPGGRLG